jgi:hypothetical protein
MLFGSLLTRMHLLRCLLMPTAAAAAFSSASGVGPDAAVVVIRSYSLHCDGIPDGRRRLPPTVHEVRPAPGHARTPPDEEDEVESLYPTVRRAFVIPGVGGADDRGADAMNGRRRRTW